MVHPSTVHEAVQPGNSNKRQIVEAAIEFTGGLAGGAASVYIGQPLDTVKVKMQTFPALYKNGFHCFKTTILRDGVRRGLYAGTVPSLAAQISENSVLFLSYGICQKTLARVTGKSQVSDLNVFENSASGSVAAFFSAFTQCPTELIKCKMQAMTEMAQSTTRHGVQTVVRSYEGPWTVTKQILRDEGLSGMFRGLVPTTVRQMIGYFFFFGGYELSKNLLTPKGKSKDELGPLRTIVCGGIGGMSFWVTTYPSDVIKSRVQIGLSGKELGGSFISILRKIIREEGVKSLYRGLSLTLLRTIPASGGLFLAFEFTKKYLEVVAGHCGVT